MPEGQVLIEIDFNNKVIATPEDVTPDASNNIEFTLVDDSNGYGWVFDERNPITIVNPADFTVTRVANGLLRVYDNENDSSDRSKPPKTHKYTLNFSSTTRQARLSFDPKIIDR